MKHVFSFILVVLFTNLSIGAQTEGTLTVSTTTSSTGGDYTPNHVLAIWIEDNTDAFVKTLLIYGYERHYNLNMWETSTELSGSKYNNVDAITGATPWQHLTRTCTWDGRNYRNIDVADGEYKLRMELTDKNETGNYSTFTFTKGVNIDTKTPNNVPSFSDISLQWTPNVTSIKEHKKNNVKYSFSPNPGTGIYTLTDENIKEVKICNLEGKVVYKSKAKTIDISDQHNGLYIVYLSSDQGIITQQLLKH